MKLSLKHGSHTSITQEAQTRQRAYWAVLFLIAFSSLTSVAGPAASSDSGKFRIAWDAAAQGDYASFNRIKDSLQGYLLFPYLQYEDYRNRRSTVPVDEMSGFLETHKDWAFAPGLRDSWLKSLAKRGQWADLVAHSAGANNAVIRCLRAHGQIKLKKTDNVLNEAQDLWLVGKSQVDECDPVFAWLKKNDGIPESLAWRRIRLAMLANNRGLVRYLARFVPADQHYWLEQWLVLNRAGSSRLQQARRWPDNEVTRMITATSLHGLARNDAALAAKKFDLLDSHFDWGEARRAELLRDIALYSAVALENDTPLHMARVPIAYRDAQLLEWWTRFLLSRLDWSGVTTVIQQMPEETRNTDRWRYWLAQALLRSGQVADPPESLHQIADKANYYGFLAADELGLAYNICPRKPGVDAAEIDLMAGLDGFRRALELRKAGLDRWATEEWILATRLLPVEKLKVAAALANRENWHDRAIFALGNSGDLQIYEWRFPLLWEAEIRREATANKLDPAWVYGTVRSESAMLETAQSSANALGLMQIIPDTGKRVARKHKLAWRNTAQLKTVAGNLPIGAAYMADLLKEYRHNPVLVSGSYNAGPRAVDRWLQTRPVVEAAIWIETLPYFETRDYIPRVLAFTTIYDWRLGGPVQRVTGRMPHIGSGKISINGSTEVVCRDQLDESAMGK